MQEFQELIEELTSLRFWVAVVFFGVLINFISAYMKPLIDKSISKISEGYKAKNIAKTKEESLLFQALIECQEFRNIHRQHAIFERTRSVWFVCMGVGLYIGAISTQLTGIASLMNLSLFIFIGGTFSFFISMKYVNSSIEKWTRSIAAYNASKKRPLNS